MRARFLYLRPFIFPIHTHLNSQQVSDHLTWAGSNAARAHCLKHSCHVTWPLHMMEEVGLLPTRSVSQYLAVCTRVLRSLSLVPSSLKPRGLPRVLLERVKQHCLAGPIGQGGLVLVTSSFGIEMPCSLPPFVRAIGRRQRCGRAESLADHHDLKVGLPLKRWRICLDVARVTILPRICDCRRILFSTEAHKHSKEPGC